MPDMTERSTDWTQQWGELYVGGGTPSPYTDDAQTYMRAGAYLAGPGTVREWGCATTWGRRFIGAPYEGVDGAEGVEVWGATRADLRDYHPDPTPKALMRHVLEHNWEWRDILANFLDSFTDRAVLILFIKPGDTDYDVPGAALVNSPTDPPGLSISEVDLLVALERDDIRYTREVMETFCPPHNHEEMFFIERVHTPHLTEAVRRWRAAPAAGGPMGDAADDVHPKAPRVLTYPGGRFLATGDGGHTLELDCGCVGLYDGGGALVARTAMCPRHARLLTPSVPEDLGEVAGQVAAS